MDINVNIKRTYQINGKEYRSREEMPQEVRALFDAAMNSTTGKNAARGPLTGKIVFNNVEYESIDDMPTYLRNIYEQTRSAVSENREQFPPGHAPAPSRPTAPEHAFSARSVFIAVLITAMAYAIYVLFVRR
jgi:hypothetical protein